MRSPRTPALTRSASPSPDAASTGRAAPLTGRALTLARATWLVIVACSVTIFLVGLPVFLRLSYTICTGAPSTCSNAQLIPADVRTLTQSGIPTTLYITLNVILTFGVVLVWFAVPAILFWRRSDLLIALLVALQMVLQGSDTTLTSLSSLSTYSIWAVPANALNAANMIVLFYVLALFPNGRFVPRWMGWLGLVWGLVELATILPGWPAAVGNSFFGFLGMMACVIGAQIYRYRRVSSSRERQQTKWIVLAVAVVTAAQAGLVLPAVLVPSLMTSGSLYWLAANMFGQLFLVLIPVAIAVSLLRYRLYDVDIIVRRTLIYGTLTAILAALYFAVVIAAHLLGQRLTGQTQPPAWVIVVTTLLIAALFTPLRRRVQRTIDHRFYRSRYNAARTIEAFAATLRTELDLTALRTHLVQVAAQTMQPARVDLWLRQDAPRPTGAHMVDGAPTNTADGGQP